MFEEPTKIDLWLINKVKNRKKAIALGFAAILFVPVAWFYFYDSVIVEKRVRSFQRKIVDESSGALAACRDMPSPDAFFPLEGYLLIWDLNKEDVHEAQAHIPSNYASLHYRARATIFFVEEDEELKVGEYSRTKAPAFRRRLRVSVVHWPLRKPVGTFAVMGGAPPVAKSIYAKAGYGESEKEIVNWIFNVDQVRTSGHK